MDAVLAERAPQQHFKVVKAGYGEAVDLGSELIECKP